MRELYAKSRYTVLTVDDDENIRFLVNRWVEREGYSSCTAADASEALELIASHNIDMAFIDYRLPGMDGFSLIKKLRRDYYFPIVVISAETDELDQIVGLKAGADDYITKPFSERLLINKLEATLRRSGLFSLSSIIPLKDGKILFNTEQSEITDGTHTVSLSRSEAIIFRALVKNIGNPVAQSEICERLSSAGEKKVNKRTLTSTVSRLKGRLASSGLDSSFLENIRGLGYVVF